MNPKKIVRLSNVIGIVSILLLIYWVFIFISVEVFGLKVFKENMTETFYMSVLGILALMSGALIINVMFNLTRIAQKHNNDPLVKETKSKTGWILILSFPLLLGFLFTGDYLTSKKKENLLTISAESIIENNVEKSNKLLNYKFEEKWIKETKDILQLYSKTDSNFPRVSIWVKDTIDQSPVILSFNSYYSGSLNDTIIPLKRNFIQQTTQSERDYLEKVFDEGEKIKRYSAHDGNYELFYPYKKNDKVIILYFSDHQRYGKIGS